MSGDKQTILIVEDEPLVRLIGSDSLEDAGYEVIEAADADEALEILEQASDVCLLFTDIRMPGTMDGMKLATLVHARWPNIRLLITSGDTWPSDADIPDDGRFLSKPYKVERLQRTVKDLLHDE